MRPGTPRTERPFGHSASAMLRAPRGAYYVVNHQGLGYYRSLARYLGRTDLRLVSVSWVQLNNVLGLPPTQAIEVDHYAYEHFGRNAFEAMNVHRDRVKRATANQVPM